MILRTPLLHTGFGAGRGEYKDSDGKTKQRAETLTFDIAGKPVDHTGAINPINEFKTLGETIDKWTIELAKDHKILGDDATEDAYTACYVPIIQCPDHRYADKLTVKLPNVYKHPQWFLWSLPDKKSLEREELGYDTLLAADITFNSIWVNYGSDTKKPKYGWSLQADNLYKPPKSYIADYTNVKEKPAVCPW